jgi:hypothetical protein
MFVAPHGKVISKSSKSMPVANASIEIVSVFKLLGVHLDETLTFQRLLSELKRAVNYRLYSMNHLYFMPISTKCKFFKSFIVTLPYPLCNGCLPPLCKLFKMRMPMCCLESDKTCLYKSNVTNGAISG